MPGHCCGAGWRLLCLAPSSARHDNFYALLLLTCTFLVCIFVCAQHTCVCPRCLDSVQKLPLGWLGNLELLWEERLLHLFDVLLLEMLQLLHFPAAKPFLDLAEVEDLAE